MNWVRKEEKECAIKNFYQDEKIQDELEFSFFETPRLIAKCWMYSLPGNLHTSDYVEAIREELKKNVRVVQVSFEPENYCIFVSLFDGSKVELCTGTLMQDGEHIDLPEIKEKQ